MAYRNLAVLDAAERGAQQINALVDGPPPRRLLHVRQLRRSSHSVVANIAEAFARGPGRDRVRMLRIARGETEETLRHLKANFVASRLTAGEYHSLRNLYLVIARMLDVLVNE